MKKTEMTKTDKVSNTLSKIVLIILIVGFCLLAIGVGFCVFNMMPVDANNSTPITFVVDKGMGKSAVVDKLKREGIIRNALVFKIYLRITDDSVFYPGTYSLNKSMNASEIIKIINSGANQDTEDISITFIEGKRFPYYINKISETFGYSEEEILKVSSDQEFLNKLINKYWFVTTDILNKDIYYPLEGYLFPDTYSFKKDASIETILEALVRQLGEKLKIYKNEIETSKYSIHGLLTLASMVELEAVSAEDRENVARVFVNRLEKSIPLGSDVTAYYAHKKEMTVSLTNGELDACNAYNTRGTCAINGLPVGPICSSSYSSITAAINPAENAYLFFMADINNKVYFSMTNDEQLKKINELKKQKLWPE
ncbi:MAG: endolytic transglycosylase MltG [Bacilli bacterium]|nr:endolytic transglycosylase MltG [Bacilli bacterium]